MACLKTTLYLSWKLVRKWLSILSWNTCWVCNKGSEGPVRYCGLYGKKSIQAQLRQTWFLCVVQPGRAQNPWHLSGNKFGQLLWRQQRNVSFRGIAYHCLAVYLLQFMAYKNFNLVYFILTLCFSSVPTLKQQVCTSLCPLFICLQASVL